MHLLIYTSTVQPINMKEKIKLNKRKLALHCVSLEIFLLIRIRTRIPILARVMELQSDCVLTNDVCLNTSVEEGCRQKK